MSTWLDELTCPICGSNDCVAAYGPKSSEILIIDPYPDEFSLQSGMPHKSKGIDRVLKKEFRFLGVDINRVRITNLWLHPPNKNPDCLAHGFKKAIEECVGRKYVLLLGADPVRKFTGMGVEDTCGLWLKSPYLSIPVMSCVNPAQMFYRDASVGEIRLAFQKFMKGVANESN